MGSGGAPGTGPPRRATGELVPPVRLGPRVGRVALSGDALLRPRALSGCAAGAGRRSATPAGARRPRAADAGDRARAGAGAGARYHALPGGRGLGSACAHLRWHVLLLPGQDVREWDARRPGPGRPASLLVAVHGA